MAGAAAAGMSVASTAVGMAGAMSAGQNQQAASEYNAAVKTQQAGAAISEANENERRARIQTKQQLGGIRANTGANGIQMEGSALDILEQSASNAELDALTIRHQGQLKAWAYTAGANLDLLQGKSAREAGNFTAASYLIKGLKGMGGGGGGGGEDSGGADAAAAG